MAPIASGAAGGGQSRDAGVSGNLAAADGSIRGAGQLDPAVIRAHVRRQFGAFRACYAKGLQSSPTLRGRVVVRFVIGPDGHVTQATDAGSDLADKSTIDCVLAAYARMVFPPPQGGALSIVYPVLLEPDQASADAGVAGAESAKDESAGGAISVPSPARLAELVRGLGASGLDPMTSGVFEQLRSVPLAAVGALIQELKVIPQDASGATLQHAVWCVRALRVLTGQDFRFASKLPLSATQREVYDGSLKALAFFRMRVSTGKVAVAPRDVQQQIILAWQDWFRERGDSFTVPDGVEFVDWYF